MSNTDTTADENREWAFDEDVFDAVNESIGAQQEIVEQWARAIQDLSQEVDGDLWMDTVEGYAQAYEVWMEASQHAAGRTADLMAGEEVPLEEFRDIWMDAANDAFKELAASDAFAAALASNVEALNVVQEADETAQTTLRSLGFATERDVTEVGSRLVELERRQHSVEEKLDRLLDVSEA